ncbi:hypothetical protein BU17DRAFT_68501 [Hysterangium stoloniferum]|nr:hypothetical protein BU17DRAFT_68501 [Hysterangium stoloniferum]
MLSLWVVAGCSSRIYTPKHCDGVIFILTRLTYNQENFSPWLVASALQAACNGGNWNISPLDPDIYYTGPYQGESNKSCGACQGRGISTWSQWSLNCTASDIAIGQFLVTIPPGLSIPSWAYLNYSSSFSNRNSSINWNSDVGWNSGVSRNSATGTPTSTGTPHKKSNQTGAIAGGVVGGVVGLALIAMTVYALMRSRNTTPQVSTPQISSGDGEKSALAVSACSGGFPSPIVPMQTEPCNYYNPSDPSTSPNASAPTLPSYAPAVVSSGNVAAYYHPQNPGALPTNGSLSGHPLVIEGEARIQKTVICIIVFVSFKERRTHEDAT